LEWGDNSALKQSAKPTKSICKTYFPLCTWCC
jgi:hypothetical protein